MTRVMIVEDEAIVAAELWQNLEHLGYQVIASTDMGIDAIILALENRPDLILMDIALKGEMDGIETASHIKHLTDIPIIYMTAFSDQKTLNRAKTTAYFGYITKPFYNKELDSKLQMALLKHKKINTQKAKDTI